MNAALQSFLAFDFGTQRVGVAVGNSLLRSAQGLRTVALVGEARFTAIAALVKEWQPTALVVGVPLHPDGAPHENTRLAQRFARQLQGRTGLPVHLVDERYSTTEAIAQGAADHDAASAAIILEQFLRGLPDIATIAAGTASTASADTGDGAAAADGAVNVDEAAAANRTDAAASLVGKPLEWDAAQPVRPRPNKCPNQRTHETPA